MSDYRWIVTVKREDVLSASTLPYVREVETDGPRPHEAANKALERITEGGLNDLWQSRRVMILVERVR